MTASVIPPDYQPNGEHLLADMYGIAPDKLSDTETIESLLRHSAQAAGAHILFSHFHAFDAGKGVTGVVLLAESHITIHTWPECGFAAADIFMCGQAQAQRNHVTPRIVHRDPSANARSVPHLFSGQPPTPASRIFPIVRPCRSRLRHTSD
ncbi:adenosylmethionine decarboxylase [Undibacterium piscinae]|uniref:Adenosylmethionine decarboxylase n=1 Tax=Undibacterium piscinae TaxID=2495591 RepID=A0A6M4A4U7_9BURK|nr:adenosylmethionine decarboxylase [Undibacterium piscinae]